MNGLLLFIAPCIGLGLALGVEPQALLRYTGAVTFFGLARDMAICQRCSMKFLERQARASRPV